MFWKLFSKEKIAESNKDKLFPSAYFNRHQQHQPAPVSSAKQLQKRLAIFQSLLSQPMVNFEKLSSLSWQGIPNELRGSCWRLLLKYMPTNAQARQNTLQHKRKDYMNLVETYMQEGEQAQDTQALKQIHEDVLRTLPNSSLFRDKKIQEILTRILYIWSIRHPASGYVQGMNDIATPFIIVFVGQLTNLDLQTLKKPDGLSHLKSHQLQAVEADSYWCLCKLLDSIQDNYTKNWPGMKKNYERLKAMVGRMDRQLIEHFERNDLELYHIFFRSVNCMLLRQFNYRTSLRLFDSFVADDQNHPRLTIYLYGVILLRFSKKIKRMNMEEAMTFSQQFPTKSWSQNDLSQAISQAYIYMSTFN